MAVTAAQAALINQINASTGHANGYAPASAGPQTEVVYPQAFATPTGSSTTPAATPAPTNPNGGADVSNSKAADISLQNAALGSLGTQTSTGLSSIDQALASLIGNYDTEATSNKTKYGTQSDTNQNNLQTNKQTALVNAAQGRRGLESTLASLGALNGSGIDLANEAVQKGANEDLSQAAGTYGTNQASLDDSLAAFNQADEERRQQANTAAGNAKTNAVNKAAQTEQQIDTNLANDYAAQGDTENANKFSAAAAALYPKVAATSIPDSNLAYTAAAFTPASLSNYIAGANGTSVSTTAPVTPGQLPGLVAQNQALKKQQQLQPA